jgi:hypothetical protein
MAGGDVVTYSPAQLNAAQAIFDYFSAAGRLQPQGAVGAVVNAFAESSLRPDVIGDHDEAFGLWQPHADTDIKRMVLADDADVEAQCAFLWRDLETTERNALKAIQAATTSAGAAYAWCLHYERPGAGATEADRRAGLAPFWQAYFKATT